MTYICTRISCEWRNDGYCMWHNCPHGVKCYPAPKIEPTKQRKLKRRTKSPVIGSNEYGEVKFPSIAEAARAANLNPGAIQNALNMGCKAGSMYWRYDE